jgi:hypothetical protein
MLSEVVEQPPRAAQCRFIGFEERRLISNPLDCVPTSDNGMPRQTTSFE